MKKTYQYIGTIDLNEVIYVTENHYKWRSAYNDHNQYFSIYFKSGAQKDIDWTFNGVRENPDTEELIEFRKGYADFITDYINL